ncbi:MAG: TIGR00300 family protein [bacterium]|jgi:lysine-ketoglutarate reductase/saccharopine dehydrogenase-like protein (TIGR00300 family)
MFTQKIELRGHIIDSHILPRVLDEIIDHNGNFSIEKFEIGRTKSDPSYALLEVQAETEEELTQLLGRLQVFGATILTDIEVDLAPAPRDGVFPDNFYATTNLDTYIFTAGRWIKVEQTEMDCGIVFEPVSGQACCVPVNRVKKGELVVLGQKGIKVVPLQRARRKEIFRFMDSSVSSEKPKGLLLKEIAQLMRALKEEGKKVLVVAGPAIIHTGAGKFLSRLIEAGYIDYLFAGNALATHDIEGALLGTSLGISLTTGEVTPGGHSHHLRAINLIRRAGGIKEAVQQGIITSGVMYSCVVNNVDYVLAGSIRDDGPLPDVITDVLEAQEEMRRRVQQVDLVLMLATMLHSIATGNLLPATVRTVCVDINPAVVTKLVDRGSFQTVGMVSDVEWFLRELASQLLEGKEVG